MDPRDCTDTVRVLVPMSEKLSVTYPSRPLPRPTMTITAATPMTMPSMVSRVLVLLDMMFFTAMATDSQMLMAPRPLSRRRPLA